MRAIAERVFASVTKDEDVREEISLFDVAEDCPILNQELAYHIAEDDDIEKRSVQLHNYNHNYNLGKRYGNVNCIGTSFSILYI